MARALLTLLVPVALVLLAVLAVPPGSPEAPGLFLGIGARIWALFACAPATSAWLWWRQRGIRP